MRSALISRPQCIQTKQIQHDISVENEIVHSPLLLSAENKILVLARCQMKFYIAFPVVCHTHVTGTSRAKFQVLALEGQHKTQELCSKRPSEKLQILLWLWRCHMLSTELWRKAYTTIPPLTSAGYLMYDGNYDAVVLLDVFFFRDAVVELFWEIYDLFKIYAFLRTFFFHSRCNLWSSGPHRRLATIPLPWRHFLLPFCN